MTAEFAREEKTGAQLVIQPLSCLSCHARGLIPKTDQIRDYVNQNSGPNMRFTEIQKEKANRIYPEFEIFNERIEKDNRVITSALVASGVEVSDREPIVASYRLYVARVNIAAVSGAVGVTVEQLKLIFADLATGNATDKALSTSFNPLATKGGEIQRSVLENALPALIARAAQMGFLKFGP